MYFPDFNGAGHALSIPVAPAQQHLDLIPRLLLDVAGTAFLVIVLLLVGLNLYGAVYRAPFAASAASSTGRATRGPGLCAAPLFMSRRR